ncbi:hypothetical protein ACFP2T_37295 [Plantactinospora solaniradicis]|uniref:Transposase n=1 Tax=Plantactinospora solaniradicis TaxID=1723736 RepID=A0ABW1KKZ6_9ACTN
MGRSWCRPLVDPAALLIPDRLTQHAVELLRTVDLRQSRTCPPADSGCAWLFLDQSRNGSRH